MGKSAPNSSFPRKRESRGGGGDDGSASSAPPILDSRFRGNDEFGATRLRGNDGSEITRLRENHGSGATGLASKVAGLQALLREMGHVVVCFSGGVDSSYLLAEAVNALGDDALALTAVSPSLAPEEGADARNLAESIGARHLLIDTYELDDPRYAANPANRCYFCKTELYGKAVDEATSLGIAHVLDGFNLDDRGDHRPGRKAARERGVRSPLDELGYTKADIREAARRMDLPVWDKPALACLSSRFPYGTVHHPGEAHPGQPLRTRPAGARLPRLPGALPQRAGAYRGRRGRVRQAFPTGRPRRDSAAFQGCRVHLRQHRPAGLPHRLSQRDPEETVGAGFKPARGRTAPPPMWGRLETRPTSSSSCGADVERRSGRANASPRLEHRGEELLGALKPNGVAVAHARALYFG